MKTLLGKIKTEKPHGVLWVTDMYFQFHGTKLGNTKEQQLGFLILYQLSNYQSVLIKTKFFHITSLDKL